MNKTKSKKILYGFLALGLIFLSFPSVVHAWGHRREVTYRDLTHWTLNNPRVIYGLTSNWDILPIYAVIPTITSPDQYTGYIREKVLDDGSAELTVIILAKRCSITVFGVQADGIWEVILEDTKYYCMYKVQFILPHPGDEIPDFMNDIVFGEMGEWLSTFCIGFGSGTFTDCASTFGFTPGETGVVYLHQEGYLTPEGEEIWPYETIELYEIG